MVSASPITIGSVLLFVVRILFLAVALLVLPIGYIVLCQTMRKAGIQRAPYIHFFFVFGGVGGCLFCMALLGPMGAILGAIPGFIAPIALLISSIVLYSRRDDSRFHYAAFWSGLIYVSFPVAVMLIASLFGP